MVGEWEEMLDLFVTESLVDKDNGCYQYTAKVNVTNPIGMPMGNFVVLTFNAYVTMHEDQDGKVSLFWVVSRTVVLVAISAAVVVPPSG